MVIKQYMHMLCCVVCSYLVIKQIEATCLFHCLSTFIGATLSCMFFMFKTVSYALSH